MKKILLLFIGLTISFNVFSEPDDESNIANRINSTFTPMVEFMGGVIFWDPFEAMGIYDPITYENGKPYVLKRMTGSISGKNGSNLIIGDETAFRDLKYNQKIIIGEKIYKVKDVVRDEKMYLHTPLDADVEKGFLGFPNQRNIPFIVVWLMFGAIFFTIRMKFINLRGFKHALQLVSGKFDKPDDEGEVSHFQALATALSGTVGLGNIASVAVAVSLGGPGATFWMILAGLLGMSSKFVECTLGVKYRIIKNADNPDKSKHEVNGGPMYYLSMGLEKRNKKTLGRILAASFALLCVGASFGGGNMFQANQAFSQIKLQFGLADDAGFYFGVVMAILVGIVIIGGIKSIAKVTEKVVPFMAGMYVLAAITVIIMNIDRMGEAFGLIFNGAFNSEALYGGFIGVLIIGFQRAAFSNEAGVGSASIAHSASKTDEPVSEGIVALLEPFIDTVVICTMTALVLVFTGVYNTPGLEGAQLTSAAFGSEISWFPYVLTIAIFLFAFSTMISWSYYGLKSWNYLFGDSNLTGNVFKILFLIFVVVGASINTLGPVLDFSDMMLLAMAFPNIIGLIILSKEVREDLRNYMGRVKSGEIKSYK